MSVIQLRSAFTVEEAQQLARKLYNLSATAQELPSERDQNFRLICEDGVHYVLKIANASESWEALDFQNEAMIHLAERHGHNFASCICLTTAEEAIASVPGRNGKTHFVRLITWLPGVPLANVRPHSPHLLSHLGQTLGRMSQTLADFQHPAMHRELYWDLRHAGRTIRRYQADIASPEHQALVARFLDHFEQATAPALAGLRHSVIHNDGNDYNVLVNAMPTPERRVVGLIDFGDLVYSCTVCELAIAAAYVMLHKADPLAAATHLIRGYHKVYPLGEEELAHLFSLICIRLCMSVAVSAHQQKLEPDNTYLNISERPAWDLLATLAQTPPQLAHYIFRHACGLPPCPQTETVAGWLQANPTKMGPLIQPVLEPANVSVFDLSVGSLLLGQLTDRTNTAALTSLLTNHLAATGAEVGVGRYNEARQLYSGDQFQSGREWRTIHLGLDLFLPAGSPVLAPLDGLVYSVQDNDAPLDYGPTLILEHQQAGTPFYTLYGHLSRASLAELSVGQTIRCGDTIASIGSQAENGGWPPHLHLQIITDIMDCSGNFDGVAAASQREVWLSICPDPNLIVGIPAACFPPEPKSKTELLHMRHEKLGKSLSISYNQPLKIVRGQGQYLYDDVGRSYLDGVNNVCHVGHAHPQVVQAAAQQMAVLNTNTRYLHDNLTEYAERLTATLPDPLNVCFFVCSGSEANELALRLARTYTGQQDTLVVDGAYHGNTAALIEISPYKFDGPGGSGAPPHIHKVRMPDGYRGLYKFNMHQLGARYAKDVELAVERLQAKGQGVAAFICESLLGCGGQIVLPEDYLSHAFRAVRQAGGVCIVDEVQVGFGRVGSCFWGFELQGVVPDIVTMGKPIGNGHPLAAVVTTPQIADAFANGMEYFNTFGGNPVSCAVGLAVLDVIETEQLQQNAWQVGQRLLSGLGALRARHPIIGDVRGAGLFIGIELVLDHDSLAPATEQASYIVNRMKDHGILLSTDGPLHNVIKLKPPLVFSEANADFLVEVLDQVLAEDFVRMAS